VHRRPLFCSRQSWVLQRVLKKYQQHLHNIQNHYPAKSEHLLHFLWQIFFINNFYSLLRFFPLSNNFLFSQQLLLLAAYNTSLSVASSSDFAFFEASSSFSLTKVSLAITLARCGIMKERVLLLSDSISKSDLLPTHTLIFVGASDVFSSPFLLVPTLVGV